VTYRRVKDQPVQVSRIPKASVGKALGLGVLVVGMAAAGCFSSSRASDGGGASPVPPRGCAVGADAAPPPVAPNGYYTSGGTVCSADGTPHLFHGVDRPSLEWGSGGDGISEADFQLMAGWGANVVRIALNQDFWLSSAALGDPTYPSTVDRTVHWAEAAGLDVILDLHWSDAGDLGAMEKDPSGACPAATCTGQQTMADLHSIEFWTQVADKYKGDGRVLFELYNEPHGVNWDVWLNGGAAGKFTAAGMQQLYKAVRGTGADNIVIAGGLSWAFDLSQVGPTTHIDGYNVMYATHPYLTSGNSPGQWETSFGHLETSDYAPVIATEFGDGRKARCTGDWDDQLIRFADDHHASWTAWAWYPGVSGDDPDGCQFPALIKDWAGTPTVQGLAVRTALAAYPKSAPRAGEAVGDAAGEAQEAAEAAPSDAPSGDSPDSPDGGPDDGATAGECACCACGDGGGDDAADAADATND
jgi:endoglucanase